MSSKNGHTGEGLPLSLQAFMLSHLNMHGDPGEYIQIPSVDASVDSVDAVLEAQKEMLRMMASKGYPIEQIKSVIEALGKKSTDEIATSTDNRQTKEDLATLARRRERDRKYQEKRRLKVKSVDAKNVGISIEDKIDTEEGIKERKKVRASVLYSKEFDSFWLSYPRHPGMGKFDAWKVWQKLPAEERSLAAEAVPKFVAWLKTQKADYPVVHACRFLSKKRFDGFQTAPLAAADFNSEEYQAARRRALDAIKGT